MALSPQRKQAVWAILTAVFLLVMAYFLWVNAAIPEWIPQVGMALGFLVEMFLGVKWALTKPPEAV